MVTYDQIKLKARSKLQQSTAQFKTYSHWYLCLLKDHRTDKRPKTLSNSFCSPGQSWVSRNSPLSLSLQSQKAAAVENAASEMGTFWMNNAAKNETAALCHDMVENYRHTGDVRPADSNLTRWKITWLHLFLWTRIHFALILPPSASISFHLANLRVINCLINSISSTIH